MSRFMSANAIATEALRKIMAFVPSDVGADGNELDIARSSLDIVLAHHLGTRNFWFLVNEIVTLTLVGAQQDYNLKTELGSGWPSDGFMIPIDVKLVDTAGNKYDVDIVRRDEWDDLEQNDSGNPLSVYFDRADPTTITLRTEPTLASGVTGWSLELTMQKFAKQLHGGGVSGETASGLPPVFNMWAIYQLAHYLGDGTLRRLRDNVLTDFRREAKELKIELERFAATEHADDHIAEPWGM